MKLSSDKGSIWYSAARLRQVVSVTLDGVPVLDWVDFDTDQGWVRTRSHDRATPTYIDMHTGTVAVELQPDPFARA